MTRTKIVLDKMSDVYNFVEVMNKLSDKVWLEDGEGCRVSAQSLLGAIYSLEWNDIYAFCERDISAYLMPWMV